MNNVWILSKALDNLLFRREVAGALFLKYGEIRIQPRPTTSVNVLQPMRQDGQDLIIVGQPTAVCKSKTVNDKCFANFHK